jgi:hypothetical protein
MIRRDQRERILRDMISSLIPGMAAVKKIVAITEKFKPYAMMKVHFDLLILY